MGQRRYGQYCGLANAADLVGERWTLLIIRDLLVGPKRFTDLRRGLGRIPTNILSTRLKRLEADGLVRRRVLPRPSGSVVYELTDYGRDLEEAVFALGRWGARSLGDPREGEVVTTDSLITALRATFRPDRARGLRLLVELHVADVIVTAKIDDGTLVVSEGGADRTDITGAPDAPDAPDAVVHTGPVLRALLAGEISPSDAVARRLLTVSGDASATTVFGRVFVIEAAPGSRVGLVNHVPAQHGQ
ncbi:winged helix-turn-helix transcriptional regulator [Saccharomonospora xinjiangensis]|uniref:Putative transcriptional regulator n=1 Tax=Saccharomonospora xinjiangensis XJ-54 TaxID=882086 RepID=I0V327_9PSEU|nr:helix-turn-helix domain-containing protein [Saccharomonospora xinjiangensis]EID54530.1 putative transcriptional regulator [Saccharomonospora xinjiangensis XJ-54]